MSRAFSLRRAILTSLAILTLLAAATQAFAVPAKQVLKVTHNQTFVGQCCFSWAETVSVGEPKTPVPVVVTFTTDFLVNPPALDDFVVGLSVNGGPCLAYGPVTLSDVVIVLNHFTERSFEWIVPPGASGTHKGTNTFTLCGGAVNHPDGSITLGFNSLAVRISQ